MNRIQVGSLVLVVLLGWTPPVFSAPARGCSVPDIYTTGGDYPRYGVVADFDGQDGPDVAVLNISSDTLAVLLNDGLGGFGPPTLYPAIAGCCSQAELRAIDIDGVDGPDILYTKNIANEIAFRLNDGTGSFGPESTIAYTGAGKVEWLEVGDLDGVNGLDLIAGAGTSGGFAVFFHDGASNFSPPINYTVTELIQAHRLVDVDGDLDLDLVTGNTNEWREDIFVAENVGGGVFASQVVGCGTSAYDPIMLLAGDFDGKNGPDLVSWALLFSSRAYVYFHDGAGGWGTTDTYPVAGSITVSGGVADFDCSGFDDIASCDEGRDVISILRNRGDGTFFPEITFPTGDAPKDILIADFDRMGGLDWAVVNWDGTLSVSLNCIAGCPLMANWLLRFDGVSSVEPLIPTLAEIFRQPQGLLSESGVAEGFASGDLDPDPTVLDDGTRMFVPYQITDPESIKLVKDAGRIRITW